MADTLAAFGEGLILVLQLQTFLFLILGVCIGIVIGIIPGLGGTLGLILLLPFTYEMEPVMAFALLMGMFAVTTTSDTITSVMLGVPGTAGSQATILDGYPLAQKGQAARALGAAYAVSAFGGVFGAMVLAISLPLILPIILAFASGERFMLACLALAMVGSLSGGSILKGLSVACLGILLSSIGFAEITPVPRYTFGSLYLLEGMPVIPVLLGVFALPEIIDLAVRNTSISRVAQTESTISGIWEGIKDAFHHRWLAVRCALIGTYIGIMPGLGPAVSDWVAYGHVVQGAKDKSQFGRGDIRGVIAPESANNAVKGGSLIPTVAFGLPGSVAAALLLNALLVQGLVPGKTMLTTQLPLTFSMVWGIVVANIIAAAFLMVATRWVAKVAFIPGHLIVPAVLLFIFMGAWLNSAGVEDWAALLLLAVLGYAMKIGGWPRPPLVLALILGPLMESAYTIAMRADGLSWMTRPVVLLIFALIVLTVVLAARGIIKNQMTPRTEPQDGEAAPIISEGGARNPLMSLPLAVLLLGIFVWATIEALPWPWVVHLFPLTATLIGMPLLAGVVFFDFRAAGQAIAERGFGAALAAAADKALLRGTAKMFATLLGLVGLVLVFGQKIGIPLFMALYLVSWGKFSWKVAAIFALGGWVVLVGFYEEALHLFWHKSLFGELIRPYLSSTVARFLI